ncbi:hypothetical protein ACXGQW_08740 [Wenyingzhuangia sp. IMCC45533]
MKILKFVILIFLLSCKKEVAQEKKDLLSAEKSDKINNSPDRISSKELYKLKVDDSNIDLKYLNGFELDADTLYMVNKNNLLKLCINNTYIKSIYNGAIFKSDGEINLNYIFDFKKIDQNEYIYRNFNSVSIYNDKRKSITNFFKQKKILYSFLGNDYNLVCDYNGVKLLNEGLALVDSLNFKFYDNLFIDSNSGFTYFDNPSNSMMSFFVSNGKIKKEQIKPLKNIIGVPSIDDFYIGLITDNYIIGFDYIDRSYIYFIDKSNYKVVKKVFLSSELKLLQEIIQNEEGLPNLYIIDKGDSYYVLALNIKQELILYQILKFDL